VDDLKPEEFRIQEFQSRVSFEKLVQNLAEHGVAVVGQKRTGVAMWMYSFLPGGKRDRKEGRSRESFIQEEREFLSGVRGPSRP